MLADVLREELEVVFCGTAVGKKSASRGAYYAGPGNKFWRTLFEMELTPRLFQPSEFPELLGCGIGLTDLVKTRAGRDSALSASDFDWQSLYEKVKKFFPHVLAFNGKRAAEAFLDHPVTYGLQKEKIGDTFLFVLPSTSGAASGYWDEVYWAELADFLKDGGIHERWQEQYKK